MSFFAATHSSINALLQETDTAYVCNTPRGRLPEEQQADTQVCTDIR